MTKSKRNAVIWVREHWLELLLAVLALGLLTVSPARLRAEESDLPSGETILDAYVKATGGMKARDKLHNRVAVASLELAAQGIKVNMTVHSARPNRNYTVVESEVTGKMEKGTDGETVWEMSDMMGAQIKEGQERADFLREANFDRFAVWRELYSDAECTGIESVDGRPAYKVRMTPVDGKPQTMYFDTESNLLVKHEFTIENPMGSIPMTSYVSDYREVDGILLPFKVKVVIMGQERVLTTESIEHNVDLPADRFELPQAIRALLEHSAEESEKKS